MNNREREVLTEHTDNDISCDEYRLEKLEKIQRWAGKHKFLIVDGVTSSDCFQGNVGSCVVIAGIQALAQKPELIETILLKPNRLSRHSTNVSIRQLNGVFRCNFGGKIVETSTKLPVHKYSQKLLGCANSAESDKLGKLELWPVYLEKCFAQHFSRGYDELDNGMNIGKFMKSVLPACQIRGFSSARSLNTYLSTADATEINNSVMLAASSDASKCDVFGVHDGHAYSSVAICKPPAGFTGYGPVVLVRNPWGKTGGNSKEVSYARIQGRFVSKEYKWILEPNNLKKWRSVYGWGDSEKTGVFCLTIGEVFRCFDQVDLVDLTTDIEKQGIDLKIKRIANGERYSRTDAQTIQVAINCETARLRAPLELPLSQKSKQMSCWIRFLLFSCLWCILVVMALVVGFYFDPSGLAKFTNDTDESKSILTAFYDWNLVWIISPN